MLKRDIKQILNAAIESHDLVKVERRQIEADDIDGLPLAISNKLCLLKELNEFHFDGFTIVRIKDISSTRCGEHEKFYKSILEREGALVNDECPLIKVDNWISVLTELKSSGVNFIIETEDIHNNYFYIGKIKELNDDSLIFQPFDSLGRWISENKEIAYKSITSITFESEYVRVFSKYV